MVDLPPRPGDTAAGERYLFRSLQPLDGSDTGGAGSLFVPGTGSNGGLLLPPLRELADRLLRAWFCDQLRQSSRTVRRGETSSGDGEERPRSPGELYARAPGEQVPCRDAQLIGYPSLEADVRHHVPCVHHGSETADHKEQL